MMKISTPFQTVNIVMPKRKKLEQNPFKLIPVRFVSLRLLSAFQVARFLCTTPTGLHRLLSTSLVCVLLKVTVNMPVLVAVLIEIRFPFKAFERLHSTAVGR